MDRSTAKLRILLILLVLSSECVFFPLIAADSLNYDRLSKMPIDDLFDLSESYKNKNLLDSSLGCYILLAGRYYDKMPSTEKYLCAKACKEAGIAYYYKYNYTKALDFLRQGVKYCEENDIPELLPSLYNNIGCVYSSLNDFRISINSFEKGLTISRELNDRTNEKILLTNLACHCSNENIKEKAELYNRELMEQFGQEDSTITFYVHLNRGWLMYNDSCYSQAVACLNQALDYARKARLAAAHESVVYETLGALYMNIPNKRDSAYYYLKTNCTFAQEHHLLPNLRNTLTKLAECYEQDGQKDKAMSYKIHYWELSDSLLDSNKFNQAKSEHFLYQMEQDYEKIKRLNQETLEKEEQIRTSRIQLLCSLAILLIFTVLTTITIIQKRKLRRAYSDLFHRNATILSSEEENRRKHARQEKELEHAKEVIRKLTIEKDQIQANPLVTPENERADSIKTTSPNIISDEQRKSIQARLEEIMENTDEVFDCNFSISRLSELVGTNLHYLSQIINETYGKNFRAFINEYRIKEAQRRLMNTEKYSNYTIKAIAESVGYKSHSSFITLFRNATGITPSLYQQLANQQKNKEQ